MQYPIILQEASIFIVSHGRHLFAGGSHMQISQSNIGHDGKYLLHYDLLISPPPHNPSVLILPRKRPTHRMPLKSDRTNWSRHQRDLISQMKQWITSVSWQVQICHLRPVAFLNWADGVTVASQLLLISRDKCTSVRKNVFKCLSVSSATASGGRRYISLVHVIVLIMVGIRTRGNEEPSTRQCAYVVAGYWNNLETITLTSGGIGFYKRCNYTPCPGIQETTTLLNSNKSWWN